jgi:hypothetical protein
MLSTSSSVQAKPVLVRLRNCKTILISCIVSVRSGSQEFMMLQKQAPLGTNSTGREEHCLTLTLVGLASALLPNYVPSFGKVFVLCEYGYEGDWGIGRARTPQVQRSLGGMQHPDRCLWCGDVMRCVGTTCSASQMYDHDRERPELIQWRGILAACFVFRFDVKGQDQPGNHLLRTSEISSSIYSLWWRYIHSVDHRSCFPVSNFRMNHPSRRNASITHG